MAEEAVNLLPDDFDEAFENLSMDDPAPAEQEEPVEEADSEEVSEESTAESADEPEEAAGDAAEEESAEAEDAAAESAESETEEEPAEEPTEEPTEEQPEAESGNSATLERLAEMIAQAREKAQAAEPEKESEPEPTAEDDEPPAYTEDELKALEEYEKEWPEVAQAEKLRRRGEYREVVDYVFNEIAQQLAPMAQMVQALSERTHLQELQDAVGEDYDTMREDVIGWVDEQPAYLQAAYKHVIDNGTVDEVADLINRFKSETGRDAPPQQEAPTQNKETELPATTKKAAASLAPVSSKRSAVPKGEDPTDFESAFSRFAGKL